MHRSLLNRMHSASHLPLNSHASMSSSVDRQISCACGIAFQRLLSPSQGSIVFRKWLSKLRFREPSCTFSSVEESSFTLPHVIKYPYCYHGSFEKSGRVLRRLYQLARQNEGPRHRNSMLAIRMVPITAYQGGAMFARLSRYIAWRNAEA